MPFTLTMPKLSPTMTEGTIIKWHKNEGDFVNQGDLLMEIATDKATVEYNAVEEGYLRKFLVPEGKSALVNEKIAIFSKDKDEEITEETKPIEKKETKTTKEVKTELPEKKACNIADAEKKLQEAEFVPEEPLENINFNMPKEDIYQRILASPLAKRIAKEKGLDLSSVKGTGPDGRIMKRDLSLAQKDSAVKFGQRGYPKIPSGTYEEEDLTPMGKAIGERLKKAKTYIPHFYLSLEIDASSLLMIKNELEKGGISITINDLIIRAVALALREYPQVNSGYNSVSNKIIRFQTIDIAVAVSVGEGLLTPIIRYADYKNIGQISVEMKSLAKKAKENKLQSEEYKGGSFTITNLGMYKIDNFAAILNPPQSAILAVGAIRDVPIVKDDKVVPGKKFEVTLSCDHRVVNGAIAAKFLKAFQKYVESPTLLLIS